MTDPKKEKLSDMGIGETTSLIFWGCMAVMGYWILYQIRDLWIHRKSKELRLQLKQYRKQDRAARRQQKQAWKQEKRAWKQAKKQGHSPYHYG